MILETGAYPALGLYVLARGRVGTDLCGHSWHLVNTYNKLLILKTGAYPALELYGTVSKGAGGASASALDQHLDQKRRRR